nr:unnamed protein product [Digitaria exilis]
MSMERELERPDDSSGRVATGNCGGEVIGVGNINSETTTTETMQRPNGGVHKRRPNTLLKRLLNGAVPTTTAGKGDDGDIKKMRVVRPKSRRRGGINAAMDHELPTKSRFLCEAECIYKEEDFPRNRFWQCSQEEFAGSKPKRTKTVKVMVDKRLKPLLEENPTRPLDLKRPNPEVEASTQRMIEWEKDILKQFETKGYAVYEREVEVTDDDEA